MAQDLHCPDWAEACPVLILDSAECLAQDALERQVDLAEVDMWEVDMWEVDLLEVDLLEVDLQVTAAAQAHPQAVWANLLLGLALVNSGQDPTWAEVLLSAAADSQAVHPLECWDYLQVSAGLRRVWDLEHLALPSRLAQMVWDG